MENRSFYNEILTEHNIHPEFKRRSARCGYCARGREPQLRRRHLAEAEADGDTIVDGAFVGDGCAISQASADIMLGMIIGREKG